MFKVPSKKDDLRFLAELTDFIQKIRMELLSGRSFWHLLEEKEVRDYQLIRKDLYAFRIVLRKKPQHLELPLSDNAYMDALLSLLFQSRSGKAISEALLHLKEEIYLYCENKVECKLQSLPFVLLVPLLFFQFPALLLLLFGPILEMMGGNF